MSSTSRLSRPVFFAAALAVSTTALAQQPVFSGAEGFGGTFNGTMPAAGWFSTASVYRVTTTQDLVDGSGRPLQGTLRGAFWNYTNPSQPRENASNRVIVFDVGGVFQLTQGSLNIKTVDRLYVAGQTAPSPVIVYGNSTQITKSSNTVTQNLIMRYMTFRKGAGDGSDALGFTGGSGTGTIATNMILDHISTSWAEDENLSVANNNTNVTVQYSIISDALTNNHAYGSLIRPRVNSNVTFHHNLYASNASRQPRLGTYNGRLLTMDFTNNVVYNWRDRAGYAGGSSEAEHEYVDLNFVGNYFIAGPSTIANANRAFIIDRNVDVRAYQQGNFIDSDRLVNPGGVPNGSDTGWGMFALNTPVADQTLVQMPTPFATPPVATQSAADAFTQVINHVGNSWWNRDPIDQRVIQNVLSNTSPGVGLATPNAAELAALLATPTVSRPAHFDSDGDGMPDAWELQMGLNPANPADGRLDFDNDQYTNLEEYLNELGAFPAPRTIQFDASVSNRYARIQNWDIPFQPSRFDTARIDGLTAVVDAIGQDARRIEIGGTSGAASSLDVTAGWLRVVEDVVIGVGGSSNARLRLTGGTLVVAGTLEGQGGSGNTLELTGGTLIARRVDATHLGGELRLAGSTLSPGTSSLAGRLSVVGGLTIDSGLLEMQIGGATAATGFQNAAAHDALDVTGSASLAGTLAVALIEGHAPAAGATYRLLEAQSLAGQFDQVLGHQVSDDLWLAVTYEPDAVWVTATVPGDANVDGSVDFVDLLSLAQWYDSTGSSWAQGDFTGDGVTGFADLVLLAQRFGTSAAVFDAEWALARSVVPEPSLLGVGAVLSLGLRRLRNPGTICRDA
jgi:pectate lyase